jgi:hypothetical protein
MTKKGKEILEKAISLSNELSNPDLTKHLYADENGDFKSNIKLPKGRTNIAYIEQAVLWIYTHPDLTEQEKLERILSAENIIHDLLNEMNIEYIPTYSTKLKTEISLKENENKK